MKLTGFSYCTVKRSRSEPTYTDMLIEKKEFIFAVTIISMAIAAILYTKIQKYLEGEVEA
jgi:hypothetical protein